MEKPTDREAWQATVDGVARVGRDLTTKPPPPPPTPQTNEANSQSVSLFSESYKCAEKILVFNAIFVSMKEGL